MTNLEIIEELKKFGEVQFYKKHRSFKHWITEVEINGRYNSNSSSWRQ